MCGAKASDRTMLRVGMLFLAVALLSRYFLRPTAAFGEDAVDAMRGLFFGLAFGFEILYITRISRRRAG